MESATFFRALSDPTRLRCIALLQLEGRLCVCELTHALGMEQPKVSRHLAQLRQAGLVEARRRGTWIHYRLHPELPSWAQQVITAWSTGCADAVPYADDRRALHAMPNRPETSRCA
ncbi:MAG: ArsR/SmtB family transcription factor [Halorhodospira sp.]